MKINRITILLGVLLLPVFVSAQENKTGNNVLTEINESGTTFTIPNIVLDSADITTIQKEINKQVYDIRKREEKKAKNSPILNQMIYKKCPDITKEQLKNVVQGIIKSEYGLPNDIGCNSQAVYGLFVSPQFDDGYHWCSWDVRVWDKNTGEYAGIANYGQIEVAVIETFQELLQYTNYSPKNIRIVYTPCQSDGKSCKTKPRAL